MYILKYANLYLNKRQLLFINWYRSYLNSESFKTKHLSEDVT